MAHKIKLEAFCERKGVSVKNKFGIVGLGQFGGKIADLFQSLVDDNNRPFYTSVAVNSFAGDLKPLVNITDARKKILKGVEDGCGRRPELAKEALANNKENQRMLFDLFNSNLSENDMYLVCAGLGGGTGTGSIAMSIKALNIAINKSRVENGQAAKAIGAIVTLPLKTAPILEKRNALTAIKELEALMNDKRHNFRFIIIVDNQKAFNDYRELRTAGSKEFDNWMDYSNNNIAQVIHELNIATNFESDKAFDPRDLKNIFEESVGCITFTKIKFPMTDINSSEDLVKLTFEGLHEKNVLANGFDFKKSRHAGVLIVKPEFPSGKSNINLNDVFDDIDISMAEEMPNTLGRYTGYVEWKNNSHGIIYGIAKIAELPQRARIGLEEEYNQASRQISEEIAKDKIETEFESIDDSIFSNASMKKNSSLFDDDPFSLVAATKQEEKKNPKDDFEDAFEL